MKVTNNSINSNVPFTALQSVLYRGKFNPDRKILHAKTVNSLVNTDHFKNLFEKYDVRAEFNAAEAAHGEKATLDLYLSKIPKTFFARLRKLAGAGQFEAHLNFTENSASGYDEAIASLNSKISSNEVKSSLVKSADDLFEQEENRKILMKDLRRKTAVYSNLDVLY